MAWFLSTTTVLALTVLLVDGQFGAAGMGGMAGMAGMQAMGQQMLTMMNTPGGLNAMIQSFIPKTGGQGALGQMSIADVLALLPAKGNQQLSAQLPPFAMNSAAAQWIPPYYQQQIFDALVNPSTTPAPAA